VQLTPDDIALVSETVYELCGIVLGESKAYLIESRLIPLLGRVGCASLGELCRRVRASRDRALISEIVNAITNRETLFFRDGAPFETLRRSILPDLIAQKARAPHPDDRQLRIWSAACSTGQEPYSLGMTLLELLPDFPLCTVSLLATDISETALAQAREGTYSDYEVDRGLSSQSRDSYFTRAGANWKASDKLRGLIRFEKRNLMEPFTDLGQFDVILCRNVAIYFDALSRESLFHRLAAQLTTDGYLFVGSSETLTDLGPRFRPIIDGVSVHYRPNQTNSVDAARPAPVTIPVAAQIQPHGLVWPTVQIPAWLS
jgi:chemotaxis protein methyltransferase CheR